MEIPELKAERRSDTGSSACRRLREEGRIPGVLYGHKEETIPVVLLHDELEKALRERARTVKLALEGSREQVVLKEVQHDALGENILHVDFARISEHEVITLSVEVRLKGTAKGVKEGGVLDQQLQEIEVRCPADKIPERIDIEVGDLDLEEALRLKDVEFPEGVLPTQDGEVVVLTIAGDLHYPAVEDLDDPVHVSAHAWIMRDHNAGSPGIPGSTPNIETASFH